MTTRERLSQVNNAPTTESVREETLKFTPEQRDLLERENFEIYTLTGKSIYELLDKQRYTLQILPNLTYLDPESLSLRSRKSEIAVSKSFFIPESNNKILRQQQESVDFFSENVSRKIPGVKAVLGSYIDYSELNLLNYFLFSPSYSNNIYIDRSYSQYCTLHTRTQSQIELQHQRQPTNHIFNIAVGFERPYLPHFLDYHHFPNITIQDPNVCDNNLYIAPLIVPDTK